MSSLRYQIVKYRDTDRNLIVTMAGVLYKENDDFLVIYSAWIKEEISWSSSFNFKVIPKNCVVEVYRLKES